MRSSYQTSATAAEKRIAKALGVTDSGLETLLKHEITGRTGNNAWPRLVRQGLVNPAGGLTEAGRDVVTRARAMGY